MILILPSILISNGLLLFIILRDKKLRNEPWRWLIGHSSLCIFMTNFLRFMDFLTPVYLLPSFETTPLCPAFKILLTFFWKMIQISITLVLIERFRAMKTGNENGCGMGIKGVVISLICFWLLNISVHIAGFIYHKFFIGFQIFYWQEVLPGYSACSLPRTQITEIVTFLLSIWSGVTAVVVIIGLMACGLRYANLAVRQRIVIPTFVVALTYFFFYKLMYFLETIAVFI